MSALFDNHGRQLRYLRLAVTDRCNLRCVYCMPEEGLNFSKKSLLLSYEEMLRLIGILADLGIHKVRITGGEPFVRKDLTQFMRSITEIPGIEKLSITTNGTAPLSTVDELKEMGIHSVNLSLDTLDAERFIKITRRDELTKVMEYYHKLLEKDITTKINMVVMQKQNIDDLEPMAALTLKDRVDVRFIEEMPFNGGSKGFVPIEWNHQKILSHLTDIFGNLKKLEDEQSATAKGYRLPNGKGTIGIIPAYTRTICGSCDRIRMTPKGTLKTCLYDNGVFSFRDFMRSGKTDEEIADKFMAFFKNRYKNGFEAEAGKNSKSDSFESMATIGG